LEDVGRFAQGYSESYDQAQWDSFNTQQKIQRLQRDQEDAFDHLRWQNNMDRLRDGLGP
jgi:hypothetical protein